MKRKLKAIYVLQSLQAKGVRLFSPSDFQRVFGVSLRATHEFIKGHCDDLFLKVRNGLYALRAEPPQDEAIVDYLYFVDLKRKTLNERLNVRKVKKQVVMEYARLFGRKSLIKLVKEIL